MINWEEVNQAENMEKLKEAKRWLFQENMRLENEKKAFFQYRDKFLDERVKLREEITALNKRTVMERKRLKQENLFLKKRWQF